MDITTAPVVNTEREKIGAMLYKFAWFIEICAVILGFSIAIMQGLASFSEIKGYSKEGLGVAAVTNIVIAMMPFIMVALVEITKIPFVGAFYKTTSLKWKVTFFCSLLFISFITFESAMNGFERNFSAMIYVIDNHKKELVNVEEKIAPLLDQRKILSDLTVEKIEKEYSDRYSKISAARQEQSNVIQERMGELRASVQTSVVSGLQTEVADMKSQLKNIREERRVELNRLRETANSSQVVARGEVKVQRRNLQRQLIKEEDKLEAVIRRTDKEIGDANFFSKNGVKERAQKKVNAAELAVERIRTKLNSLDASSASNRVAKEFVGQEKEIKQNYKAKIDSLEVKIRAANTRISKSLGTGEEDIQGPLGNYSDELAAISLQFKAQDKENIRLRDEDLKKLKNNKHEISKLDVQVLGLKNLRIELRSKINTRVGNNQVYRMAQWWFNKESAADLDRKDVMIIAAIWFGSLATLVAFTGILLALASYVIRDVNISDTSTGLSKRLLSNKLDKVLDSMRRWWVYRRRVLRTPRIREVPVEVVREVAVERIVTTEKPVEIIKKEIVHVPLYTNDESLLNIQRNNDGIETKLSS